MSTRTLLEQRFAAAISGLLILVLQSPALASANLCYVTSSTEHVDHHSGGSTRAIDLDESTTALTKHASAELVFSNAIVNPVTVLCPLDIHPALPVESAMVNVIRLREHGSDHDGQSVSEDSSRDFSCALMSRSAAGGQASGRRVSRTDSGHINLPGPGRNSTSGSDDHSHYRFIECELPAYSAIVSYSAKIKTADTSVTEATDVHTLLEALMDKPLPGTAIDEKAAAGNNAATKHEAYLPAQLRRPETPR